MSLTLRNIKGAPLTYTELDDNFLYLEGAISSSGNTFTTGATLVGNTIVFDRNDTLSAYTVDLSTLAPTAATPSLDAVLAQGNITSGSSIIVSDGDVIESESGPGVLDFREGGGDNIYLGNSGSTQHLKIHGTFNELRLDSLAYQRTDASGTIINNQNGRIRLSRSSLTGTTTGELQIVDSNPFSSVESSNDEDLGNTFISSRGSQFEPGVFNSVIAGGVGITAETSNTLYADRLNISTLGAGTSINNLGIDSDGNVVVGSASGATTELWLSGTGTGSVFTFDPVTATTNSVSGNYAIAAGYIHNINGGNFSAAFGYGQTINSSGNFSFAAGRQNTLNAEFSNALGFNNTNNSFYSLTVGQNNNLQSTSNYGYVFGQNNTLENNANHCVIMGGISNLVRTASEHSGIYSSRNSIMEAENSVILGGVGLTADTDNTVYVPHLNIGDLGTGTSVNNLGIDADGNVVVGSGTGTTGNFLPLSGGTLTGDLEVEGSIIICNSGATASSYTDCSNNEIQSGVTNSAIAAGSGNTINSGLDNVFVAGVDLTATASDTAYFSNINVDGDAVGLPYSLAFAASDETTAIVSGNSVTTLYAPIDFDVTKVKVSLSTSGSSTTTIDVKKNGTTILSSPISLSSGVFVNSTTSISSGSFDEDDRITVDITAAGTDAAGVKVYLVGKNR